MNLDSVPAGSSAATSAQEPFDEGSLSRSELERRTFAIISHPDAGKTTLTEALLQSAGAIHEAGEVRARGNRRRAQSDWMKIEQQRGISVTSSVMTFQRRHILFNLLDTPGHQDFSEDTYRTLTAVDCAIMVIDAAKGIEAQTRKLFEVCRLRNIPIITFVNKVDREGLSPFALLDEAADKLQLDVSPQNWPTGIGGLFHGLYDFRRDELLVADRSDGLALGEVVQCSGIDDESTLRVLPAEAAESLHENGGLAAASYPEFDLHAFRNGDLTPVFFGSALRSFGIQQLLDGLADYGPPPQTQPAIPDPVDPSESRLTGFIFKVQANMDPNHRDRIAFLRVCSGTLVRGMKVTNTRSRKALAVHNPITFFARDRELAEGAVAGDIVGIPNHGTLRVGDTLTEKGDVAFTGLPDFAPEILRRVVLSDQMKVKQMRRGLSDLAEEGVIRLFKPAIGSQWVVGVIGELQLEVLATRMEQEYGAKIDFEPSPFDVARWLRSKSPVELKRFIEANHSRIAADQDETPVLLMRNSWEFDRFVKDWPEIEFAAVRERN
ncbi:peptide chain release factor 3 [Sphingomonas sp. LY160]|uniref:peptide chain release factor 3 n=1 Tax=Sphingomonas sp. LY160 TaxID=3095342 RepID=UPI002ADEC626|nr:peptide chain release factor 3 [Sphingomonas sp. LY160]MEA1072994.1 peptide chain release factor 3 [Sphingomonas sp. LY160]